MPKLNQLFTQKGFIKLSKNTLISFLIVSTLLVGTGIIFLFNPFFGTKSAEAAWFNDNWGYRKSLTFTHNATVSTPSKVKFDIDTTAAPTDFQADCGDVRFTSPNGDILPYYYDSAGGACDTNSTDFYVLIPSIINGSNYIYIYYGNPSITDGTRSANFSESTTTPSGGAASVGSEEKAPSPTGYWKFDDGQATTAQDATTNNRDGTLTNMASPGTGNSGWQTEDKCIAGKCLKFDGTNDYVTTGVNATNFITASAGTLSVWYKPIGAALTPGTNLPFDTPCAVCQSDGSFGIQRAVLDGQDRIWIYNYDGNNDKVGITYNLNEWVHITWVHSGGIIYAYKNGILISSTASGNTTGSSNNLFMGASINTISEYDNSYIDEVKTYNSALSAAQILANYNSRSNPEGVSSAHGANTQNMPAALSNGLVGYWKTDETSSTAADSSGNGLTLTNNNTVAYAAGKFGNAASFTAASSRYLSTATTITGIKTVSFWTNNASTSDEYINLTSGAYITSSSGTVSATGFTSPSIYVNGVLNGTLTASVWNHVVATSTTAINANQFEIGRGNSAYNNDKIDDTRVYNRDLSSAEISQLYNWAPGPVGYWKMEETSTSSVDSSGNALNGTWNGNTISAAGKYGKGGYFDGTGDYVEMADNALLRLASGNEISFMTWFKVSSTAGNSMDIVGKNLASGSNIYNLGLSFGCLLFTAKDGSFAGPNGVTGTCSLRDDRWHHAAATYNSSTGVYRVYLDGKLDISGTSANTGSGSSGTFQIGNNVLGSVDEVKVYNYARTQGQVVEDMNAGHPAPGSPVSSAVAHWKLDEGYETSAQDYSGQANTLTLNTATSAWTNSGKFNKAWVGLGTNWLSKADDDDFDFSATDDGSISMWFKSTNASNPGATEYLLSKGPGATLAGYSIYANTSGFICYGVDDDTTFGPDDSACTTTDIYDATWHHIVAVKTATSRIDLYVDGRPTASDTSIAATGSLANSTTLYVGDFNGTDNGNEFNGTLDEIKVYRSALTADQVKIDMNRSSSQVMGATSASSNSQPNSAANEYCPPDSATAVCTGPVGEWKLDEGSGLIANDSSGNANTADIVAGNGSYINSKFNKGYSFDALSTHIFAGSGSTLDNLGASGGMTFEAWIFPKSRGENNNAFIAAKNAGNSQATGGWLFLINGISGNQAGLEFVVDGSTDLVRDTAATTITLNQWNHVAVSWDGVMTTASTARIFVNGKEATYTGTTNGATRPDDGASSLYIGNASSTDRTFDGIIDQVKVFNYNRSQAQISWSYNKGGPIAHWKMDECQGTTINDMSGNSYTGTLTNATAGTCQTSGSWFNGVSGKRNYSMSFDGTNDYITASDTSLPTGSNPRSISAWIKTSSSTNQHILTYGNSAFANNQIYLAIYNLTGSNCSNAGTNSTYALVLGSGVDPNNICDNKSLVDGGWHHVVGVVNGSTITLYVDGVQRITSATLTVNTALAGVLRIGSTLSGTIPFNGQIDDTRVYNYPLTPTQVKTLYNDGATRYGPTTGAP